MSSATIVAAPPRLWQVPIFFLGLISVTGVGLYLRFVDPNGASAADHQLATARAALGNPEKNPDSAIERAQQIVNLTDASPQARAEAHFLLGCLMLRKADANASEAPELTKKAKHHLEQADRLGVADGDRAKLAVNLAKVWLATGTDPKQVIPAVSRVVDAVDDPFEAYGLLAEAYRRLTPPDAAGQLEALRQQVALAKPKTDTLKLAHARLQLGELLILDNKAKDARLVLNQIGSDAPVEITAAARRALARCYEDAKEWGMAAQAYEQLQADPKLPTAERVKVLYAQGHALAQAQQFEPAVAAWVEAAALGGPEGQAAALRVIEMRLNSDPRSVPAILAEALKNVARPEEYDNKLISLDELRLLAERASEQLRSKGEYAAAAELANVFAKVAVPGQAAGLQGLAFAAWADALSQQNLPATEKRTEAAKQFLAAATVAPTGKDQADWLWHAANCALKGKDYTAALDALTRYVTLEEFVTPERIITDGWMNIGIAHRMLKQNGEAKAAYLKCLAAPSAVRFKARYELAQLDLADARQDSDASKTGKLDEAEKTVLELRAKVKFDDAEKMLQDNLTELRQAAQPDPVLQELTVYGLGDIAFDRADYATAEPRYRGAIQEYAASEHIVRARYRLAHCIYKRAVDENAALNSQRTPDDQRQRVQRQYLDNLTQASEQFNLVSKALATKPANSLTAAEREMLTRAGFSVAELQALSGQYQDSLASYESLAERYAGQIEGLHALHQVWQCYFYYLKQDAKAVDQLERLREAVEKAPADLFNGSSDMHNKNYWYDKIVDMSKKMSR